MNWTELILNSLKPAGGKAQIKLLVHMHSAVTLSDKVHMISIITMVIEYIVAYLHVFNN